MKFKPRFISLISSSVAVTNGPFNQTIKEQALRLKNSPLPQGVSSAFGGQGDAFFAYMHPYGDLPGMIKQSAFVLGK